MLELSARPAEAILGRTVTLTFAGRRYVLPVLTIGANRKWKAELDAGTAALVEGLGTADEDVAAILTVLGTQTDTMLDLLYAYDTSSVLPARPELEAIAYEDELLTAVQEVWRAANPLVVMALAVATAEATSEIGSSPPTNTSPPPTAGAPTSSRTDSPTSNSSPISTRRRTGGKRKRASTSSPA